MNLAQCDDGGHTTQPWDEDHHLAVRHAIRAAIYGPTILPEYLTRSVDLRWPGLLSLALLGGHPLRLALTIGELPEPIPVGPDVLGVDIEEDNPWQAVIALEPATGPGACAVLLSDCVVEDYEHRCAWPERDDQKQNDIREPVGDGCRGLSWAVVTQLPCRELSPDIPDGWTQPFEPHAVDLTCAPIDAMREANSANICAISAGANRDG